MMNITQRRFGFCACSILATLLCGLQVQANADEPIRLANDPAVSPDGSTIAFAYQNDIWTVSSAGGSATRLTVHPASEADPHFSPDGKLLAFTSNRTGSRQVYVMPVAGGSPRQLTHHTEGYAIEDWYPDSQALLVSGSRDHFWRSADRLFRIPVEGRTAERAVFNAACSEGRISPDGKRILFVREGERWWRKQYRGARMAQIWLYDIESQEYERLVDKSAACRSPLWKRDGSGFYFVGDETGSFNLWVYDFESEVSTQLTQFADDSVVFPAISHDGSTIVFRHLFDLYRYSPGSSEAPVRLEIVDAGDRLDDGIDRRTLENATDVAFSNDGLEIAFVSGGDLWVMDTELREPQQITDTAAFESDPVFSPDGNRVLFIHAGNGRTDIWQAERSDSDLYWWQNSEFTLKQLTDDTETEGDLTWSPDGKHVAFVRERGDLWLMESDGKNPRKLVTGFLTPDFDFSPDGKWIVYSLSDDEFNNEIWVKPIDGSREPFNISRHPDNDGNPVWSPDGRIIAFTGQRIDTDVDIHFVWLRAEDEDKTSRARRLEKALEKIQKARKQKPNGKKDAPKPDDKKPDEESAEESGDDEKEEKEDKKEEEELPEVVIDFEGIHDRIHRISIPDTSERGLLFSPDSKKLAFSARIADKSGTYTVEIPDGLTPKLLSTTTGFRGRWLKKPDLIAWISGGKPATLSGKGEAKSYAFRAFQEVDRAAYHQAGFDSAWRTMRDWWYDGRFNNRNWDEIRRKYRDMASDTADRNALATVISLMLGELNGSHLGFTPTGGARQRNSDDWNEVTAHLGVRFVDGYNGPGLKVRDVIPESPATRQASQIDAGEIILSIDGTPVDPAFDLTQVLNGRMERDISLRVRNSDGEDRDITLRPFSYGQARRRLYDKWEQDNRKRVEELSNGKFGYCHIARMDSTSFAQFQQDLYDVGYGKDGLVIDVRNNPGGSTTDHLLTALTQPVHAITVPRGGSPGYPHDRKVYASWSKPIVVLCNQSSGSNAEIFSHAIKTLDRGKVVGVPTAGAVISTGSAAIMDLGILRRPFRGWYVLGTGEDMELNGAVPDFVLWPEPGQLSAGHDIQLDKAVEVLRADVEEWLDRPQAELRKASERGQ